MTFHSIYYQILGEVGGTNKRKEVMKKIKVKYDDDDVEVIKIKKVNETVDRHFIGALNAIRLGMKYSGGRK